MTNPTQMNRVGLGLRNIRESLGLTQAQLASMAGVEPSYLSKVENGASTATPDWVAKVTNALSRHLEAAA